MGIAVTASRSARDHAPQISQRVIREQEAMMSLRLPKNATLGDLIAAVTDAVSPLTRGSANMNNILVSYIVRDLFAQRRVRLSRRRMLKFA
jgi:hypothetical protein